MDFHRINTQGRIWIQRVDDVSLIGHTSDDEGRLLYSKSDDKMYIASSTAWVVLSTKYSVLEAGSTLLFGAYPLPTGWNITSYNDVIVSITDSSGQVGSFGGGWSITGLGSAGVHDHDEITTWPDDIYVTYPNTNTDYTLTAPIVNHLHQHTLDADGTHAHSFDGTWRPRSVKFCEAVLQ